jgi:hypothetical protein
MGWLCEAVKLAEFASLLPINVLAPPAIFFETCQKYYPK